ncbi:hypothetical protein HPP92_004139 [Vanilla planifolia]|uniref:Pentatricopeptide repeat-containing protein n=1 Tax=Vanilla planifolia TaxID=51239 RepID=A0A835VM50_VANPL|nr:hypothetical protein HPP92_004139 [Vanilla planifolia]
MPRVCQEWILPAFKVFNRAEDIDLVIWSAMISCLEKQEHNKEAIALFKSMVYRGVKPNQFPLASIASAASDLDNFRHSASIHTWIFKVGLEMELVLGNVVLYMYMNSRDVKEGCFFLNIIEHYACMVSILGTAGNLDVVERLIAKMEITLDSSVWQMVLAAGRIHKNVALGERAAKNLFKSDPQMDWAQIYIYADSAMWGDVARVRTLMRS